MKKKFITYPLFAFLAIICVFGCSEIRTVADVISNPSAREIYRREFKNKEEIFSQWQFYYENAFNDSLEVKLPYGEKGQFVANENTSYNYIMTLEKGKIFTAEVTKDSINHRVFMDILEWKSGKFEVVQSSKIDESGLEFTPKESGIYKIIIQPEIASNTKFFIALNEKPLYGFPVAGKGNDAIQSFWGNERDGGKRNHEGIDIFAPKGTPVVAVTEGSISDTGNRGLGGKQVWLRSGLFGNSLYYAHLDSIAVNSGDKVKVGDTLGFVGNTGNAKFTPPHLHFGIYQGYGGAIDPKPFVYKTPELASKQFPKNFKTTFLRIKNTAILRKGPATTYAKVGELQTDDQVVLLGENKDWLHIKTATNQVAFLHKRFVKEIK